MRVGFRQFVLLGTMLWPLLSHAIDFGLERMLSPGELSTAHAKYEGDCKACHSDFKNQNQNPQCLECHEDVGRDIKSGQGFHGRKPGIADSECRLCHSEHRGRDADIVQLNSAVFNHTFTDFGLHGKHSSVACSACHADGKKFREAPAQCFTCHKDDDVHKGGQGKECGNCHSAERWRKAKFDHSKTHFPLKGAHQQVSCNQCHHSEDFSLVEKQCVGCHRIDDAHSNAFGERCDSCHNSEKWSATSFNHQRETRFALRGAHQNLSCAQCHAPGIEAKQAPTTCSGCHKNDDPHFGRNGSQCGQCHDNQRWARSVFDHSKTDFPLRGAHEKVECQQCHKGDVHKPIADQGCYGCHQQNDVHKKSMGTDCGQCHSERQWSGKVSFDHDLTNFPLLGMHAVQACESCHLDFVFKGIGTDCKDCHAKGDPHKGSLGQECGSCHHPVSWSSWKFDHNKQTDFALEGAHKGLVCDSCHTGKLEKMKGSGQLCGSCHQTDDIHRGAYGDRCDSCHNVNKFTEIRVR